MAHFQIDGKVIVVTGGAGFLGKHFAEVFVASGADVVVIDINKQSIDSVVSELNNIRDDCCLGLCVDITDDKAVLDASKLVQAKFGRVDVLINNAARNPKVEGNLLNSNSRLEFLALDEIKLDLEVGLIGSVVCCRHFGALMTANGDGGVIVNISSDLGLIGPNQKLYQDPDLETDRQPVKPVSYSIVKSGLVGLTRYMATYWADKKIRCNAVCPGGVYNSQPDHFVDQLVELIPAGRMAIPEDISSCLLWLASDESSYVNGAIIPIDGGRTAW